MKEKDLITGEVYYLCGYSDPSGTIPQIFSLQFMGKNCSWNKNTSLHEDYFVFSEPSEPRKEIIRGLLQSNNLSSLENNLVGMETIIPSGSLYELKDADGLLAFLKVIQKSADCRTASEPSPMTPSAGRPR